MTNEPPGDRRKSGLLFLCVANSARSQMAEAFARFIGPADMEYFSAGSRPTVLSPLAVRVMREVGVDISGYRAKSIAEVPMDRISTVVSLCEDVDCPVLPDGVHHLAWPLPDPAAVAGGDAEILQEFRRVRDLTRELVSRLF